MPIELASVRSINDIWKFDRLSDRAWAATAFTALKDSSCVRIQSNFFQPLLRSSFSGSINCERLGICSRNQLTVPINDWSCFRVCVWCVRCLIWNSRHFPVKTFNLCWWSLSKTNLTSKISPMRHRVRTIDDNVIQIDLDKVLHHAHSPPTLPKSSISGKCWEHSSIQIAYH